MICPLLSAANSNLDLVLCPLYIVHIELEVLSSYPGIATLDYQGGVGAAIKQINPF